VIVSPASAQIFVGQTVQFSASVRDAGGNLIPDAPLAWSSSAPGVATVNPDGVVSGVGPGSATITAESNGLRGTSGITVTLVPVASVVVTPGQASLEIGETVQLVATAKDSAGGTLTGRPVSWSSADPAVAVVSAEGLVAARAEGSATVTATIEGQRGSSTIGVTAAPPPNQPPVAEANGPYAGVAGQEIQFTRDGSYDPDGAWTMVWDFGDGSVTPTLPGNAASDPRHAYAAAGTYVVTLTATDPQGLTDQDSATVTVAPVNEPPTAEANGPYLGRVGAPVQFTARGSSDAEGAWTMVWDFGDGVVSPPLDGNERNDPTHVYEARGTYVVTLTVTDEAGLTDDDTATVTILP
jgi:PKD repeat protein